MPARARPIIASIAVALVLATACGDDGGATTTTTVAVGTATTTIEVWYAGGTITGGGKHSVKKGETVAIQVHSDVADEVHLHGYDKKADAGPGTVATITFVADKAGIFEVELENKGLKLFELEVK